MSGLTRFVVCVDIECSDPKEAYRQMRAAMNQTGLGWETSDEWYDRGSKRVDGKALDELPDLWCHTLHCQGPWAGTAITRGPLEIGWHLQHGRSAFFVPGKDIKVGEMESYEKDLRNHGIEVVTVRREIFNRFMTEGNSDPFLRMAAELSKAI